MSDETLQATARALAEKWRLMWNRGNMYNSPLFDETQAFFNAIASTPAPRPQEAELRRQFQEIGNKMMEAIRAVDGGKPIPSEYRADFQMMAAALRGIISEMKMIEATARLDALEGEVACLRADLQEEIEQHAATLQAERKRAEAAEQRAERLQSAGHKLANICFNLKQFGGDLLKPEWAASMASAQEEWDRAATPRQPEALRGEEETDGR